jgi:hypothetical protein
MNLYQPARVHRLAEFILWNRFWALTGFSKYFLQWSLANILQMDNEKSNQSARLHRLRPYL